MVYFFEKIKMRSKCFINAFMEFLRLFKQRKNVGIIYYCFKRLEKILFWKKKIEKYVKFCTKVLQVTLCLYAG